MLEFCQEMNAGEVLNTSFTQYPLYEAVLYGDEINCTKFSKRLSCAIKHLHVRVRFTYEYNVLKAVEKGIKKDPTLVLNGNNFIEGLVQAEEITSKFRKLINKENKMTSYDDMVRNTVLKNVPSMKIDIETFIEKFNNDEAILLDIRIPIETKVWGIKFATKIPYNELPDRLNELPKDKAIVCACPHEYRASMAKEYLRFKGFDAKTLNGGLLALMERLKGGKVKDINLS